MLNVLPPSLTLNKSSYYFRMSLLVYMLCFVMIYKSSLHLSLQILLYGFSFYQVLNVYRGGFPTSCRRILFTESAIMCIDRQEKCSYYTDFKLIHDMGLAQLYYLIDGSKKKKLLIFSDQISREEYRQLTLIEQCAVYK